jgi:hypothetical protein
MEKYVEHETSVFQLLNQWFEGFKSNYGHLDEAQATIKEVEEALQLYNDVIGIWSREIYLT